MARVQVGETTSTDMSAFEAVLDTDPPLTHWFPRGRLYRRSGARVPQAGDVAWCGYVLDTPGHVGVGPARCAECMMIRRDRGLA